MEYKISTEKKDCFANNELLTGNCERGTTRTGSGRQCQKDIPIIVKYGPRLHENRQKTNELSLNYWN